jgi:hypothetical protein
MKAENFESRLSNQSGGDIVLRTNGRECWLSVEGGDGRGLASYLTPAQVRELKAMLINWEHLYNDGCFAD